MDLEIEMGGTVPEPYAENGIFGWEESSNTRPVRSDGIRIFVVCGVFRKFEPGDVDNLLEYGMEGRIAHGGRLRVTDVTRAISGGGATIGKGPHVILIMWDSF
jgi:hypothetical protein